MNKLNKKKQQNEAKPEGKKVKMFHLKKFMANKNVNRRREKGLAEGKCKLKRN
jgi:hypothetical protein